MNWCYYCVDHTATAEHTNNCKKDRYCVYAIHGYLYFSGADATGIND